MHTVCYLPEQVEHEGLVPHVFAYRGSAGSKGSVSEALGYVMSLSIYDVHITVRVLIAGSMHMGPVGGPFLNEGPHEIMHNKEF